MADKRFGALRVLATLVKIFAVIVLLAGIIVGSLMLGMGTVGAGPFRDALGGMTVDVAPGPATAAGGAGLMLVSILYFVMLYGAAEGIYLLIAVEENSRESANLMREMWTMFGPPKKKVSGGIQQLGPEAVEVKPTGPTAP